MYAVSQEVSQVNLRSYPKQTPIKVKNYQELIAWQRAMDLIEDVYKATKDFPRDEIYALTSQIRREVGRLLNGLMSSLG